VKKNLILLSWIIIGLTLPLLGMLAWNQFNWLQELQKREEERIQYSMLNSAQALSKRMHEELYFLPSLLNLHEGKPEDIDKEFLERYKFWQYYAISPEMIRSIFIVNDKNNEILKWEKDHFTKIPANDVSLKSGRDDGTKIMMPVFLGRNRRYMLQCLLDKKKMDTEVIPSIAKDSLASTSLYAYRIIDTNGNAVVYDSLEKPIAKTFANPDIEIPLLENLKFPSFENAPDLPSKAIADDALEAFTFIKQRTKISQAAPPDAIPSRVFESYRLQIVNLDGSLKTISRNATIQNACLSFGVVALLVLLMVALAETTRRSNALAMRQQEFIATITHELKTPLAVISSAAQNLTAGLIKDQKKAEQYGTMIRKEASRLGVSIEHFLLYSNTGSAARMKPELCDVAELVNVALRFTDEERAAMEFSTEVIMPEEPVFIRGDRIALESVFQNLAQNVIRHAAAGKYLGIITVEESAKPGCPRSVIIKIRDKGPGIPPREQKTIFEPFMRGRRAVSDQIPGNGIGLNLVKRIIIMHGGIISLESKQDAGSTFTITLPESKGDADAE
jgi:two-component system phosphate regulon sensor histidine kinase PhoR